MADVLRNALTYAGLRTGLGNGEYIVGQEVYVQGRAASGDGGEGNGQVIAIGSLTDDGGVTLTGGSLAWVRPTDGRFLVDFFGPASDAVDAINAAGTAAADSGGWVIFRPDIEYVTDDTVTIPPGVDLDMCGGYINYTGTRDREALVIGSESENNGDRELLNIDVRSETRDWSDPAFVGVKICRLYRSRVSIRRISGFYDGFVQWSGGGGYAYNRHDILHLVDNRRSQVLRTEGAGGFVNENTTYGGRFGLSSSTAGETDAYGVVFTWDKSSSYKNHNSNVWFHPAFEMYQAGSGASRVPVFFDGAGQYNRIIEARIEDTSEAIHAEGSGVENNLFSVAFADDTGNETAVETDEAQRNIVLSSRLDRRTFQGWNSGAIVNLVGSSGASVGCHIKGDLFFTTNGLSSSATTTSAGIEPALDHIRLGSGSNGMGFYLDTSQAKHFLISLNVVEGFSGRIYVNCFDSNGVQLTSGGGGHPYVRGLATYSATFGGGYTQSSDTFKSGIISFGADVAYCRVVIGAGTNEARIRSIAVQGLDSSVSSTPAVWSGISRDPFQSLASAKPDTSGTAGRYARGNIVCNSSAASGQPAFWQCSTTGYLAPAWAASTAYEIGQLRENGGNVYVCRADGTSDASSGPSGTGTGITDNTTEWDFVVAKAAFVTGASTS